MCVKLNVKLNVNNNPLSSQNFHSISYTLLEIYLGGDKYRNFDSIEHFVPKIISAEIYLQPLRLMQKVRIFDEKRRNISPPKIKSAENKVRRNIFPVRYHLQSCRHLLSILSIHVPIYQQQ